MQNNSQASARIADLHAEIRVRDRQINELENELAAKDAIIRRQVIIMAESRVRA